MLDLWNSLLSCCRSNIIQERLYSFTSKTLYDTDSTNSKSFALNRLQNSHILLEIIITKHHQITLTFPLRSEPCSPPLTFAFLQYFSDILESNSICFESSTWLSSVLWSFSIEPWWSRRFLQVKRTECRCPNLFRLFNLYWGSYLREETTSEHNLFRWDFW